MPFADLTLTRDDIDAFEGETFRGLNTISETTWSGSTQYWNTSPLIWTFYQDSALGLSLRDSLSLSKAKSELQLDIVERMRKYINDGTYSTEEQLLDAIYDADESNMLVNLLVYKFFEIWFQQDATNKDGMAYEKYRYYFSKYVHYLSINLQRIGGRMATPKLPPRYRMRSSYGY